MELRGVTAATLTAGVLPSKGSARGGWIEWSTRAEPHSSHSYAVAVVLMEVVAELTVKYSMFAKRRVFRLNTFFPKMAKNDL